MRWHWQAALTAGHGKVVLGVRGHEAAPLVRMTVTARVSMQRSAETQLATLAVVMRTVQAIVL